jgi:hypothetical protein
LLNVFVVVINKDLFSLYSNEWIREVDNPTIQTAPRLRYNDLPSDVQARLLADLNQELIDHELKNMMTDLSGQTITNRVNFIYISYSFFNIVFFP